MWSYIVDQWVLVNFKFKVNGLYKLLCFSGCGHGGGGQRRSMEQGQNCIFCVGFQLCLTQQIRIKEMGIMSSWSNWLYKCQGKGKGLTDEGGYLEDLGGS